MSESQSRIGVRINREVPAKKLAGLVRQAEQAGLDEIWVVEDCFYVGGIAAAATALAESETITVGVGVLSTVVRNPGGAAPAINRSTPSCSPPLTKVRHGTSWPRD